MAEQNKSVPKAQNKVLEKSKPVPAKAEVPAADKHSHKKFDKFKRGK